MKAAEIQARRSPRVELRPNEVCETSPLCRTRLTARRWTLGSTGRLNTLGSAESADVLLCRQPQVSRLSARWAPLGTSRLLVPKSSVILGNRAAALCASTSQIPLCIARNGDSCLCLAPWIAPRRSGFRVPLAPLAEGSVNAVVSRRSQSRVLKVEGADIRTWCPLVSNGDVRGSQQHCLLPSK